MKTNFKCVTVKRVLFFLLLALTAITPRLAKGQVITGTITDSENQPVPYATIYVSETKEGTTSNLDGNFRLQLPKGFYNLTIRSMGYLQQNKQIELKADSIHLPIQMRMQEFEIKEVKVFPGQEDPAYFIMRKAISKAAYHRQKIKHYEAALYIKSNFEFTNIPKIIQKQEVEDGKKFKDYFKENVTYVIESQNRITFDYPDKYDQKVISKKSSLTGFDEPPVMGLMTASFYQERPNQVISPLSPLALKHYDFRYEGFISVGESDVFKIKVSPKRKSDELVEGFIYIVDKLYCIYNLDFSSSFEFFDYRIKQQFENLGNENWLPVSHNISGKIGVLGMRGTFYYGASVKYDSIVDNHTATPLPEAIASATPDATTKPKPESSKTKILKQEVQQLSEKEELSNADVKKVARLNRKILKEQYKDSVIVAPDFFNSYNIDENKDSLQTNIQWDTIRAIPLTPAEIESYQMADSLVAIETMSPDSLNEEQKKQRRSLTSKIIFGHYKIYSDSLFRLSYDGILSPENFDFNAVDGYKYKQKLRLRFNPDSAKYIFIVPELGYAFNRKAFFGSLSSQFINILGDGNRFGIAAGKISRDFKNQPIGISPPVNSISSYFFAKNYMKLYETEFVKFNLSQKFSKRFTVAGDLTYNHFYPLENTTAFPLSDNKNFSSNTPKGLLDNDPALLEQKSFDYTLGIYYRKRQRKPWLQESPFLFINDFYSFNLIFKQGVKDIFSSDANFSHIDFKFRQQANLSPSSGIDWQINAGYFFNADQMHFSQYKHFATSEIPVSMKAFTNTLQLLNDYQYSTNDKYLNVSAEFRSEYILLRYLSFINTKTWSESLHLNYLTTPGLKNYWETGYSINNLFFVGNAGIFAGFKGSEFESVGVKFSISID